MSNGAVIRAKRIARTTLILGGVQIAGALALTLASAWGWIEGETVTRGVMVLIGVMLVAIGNSLPKHQEGPPSQTVEDIVVRQSITRFGGWMLLLGGFVWIGFWLFAPRDLAELGSVAAVGTTTLAMAVYAFWRFRSHRQS